MGGTLPFTQPLKEVVADRYELLARLGEGGFGTVYRALDLVLRREVALKVVALHAEEVDLAEARAAARLNHPAVATLYEAIQLEDRLLLVYELVEGRSLADHLARGDLSLEALIRVGCSLCEALAHAHRRGVVHGDVTPANLLVVGEGPAGRQPQPAAKLTDFGAATVLATPTAGPRARFGTPPFVAPEVVGGEQPTPASDLYGAATTLALAFRRAGLSSSLPATLASALARSSSADPAARGTVAELEAAFTQALGRRFGGGGIGPTLPLPTRRLAPSPAAKAADRLPLLRGLLYLLLYAALLFALGSGRAALLTVALLPFALLRWPQRLAALAGPLLGVGGYPLLFPALAGRLRSLSLRLTTAFAGSFGLLLAQPLAGRRFLLWPGPLPHQGRPGLGWALQALYHLFTVRAALALLLLVASALLLPRALGPRLLWTLLACALWAGFLTASLALAGAPWRPSQAALQAALAFAGATLTLVLLPRRS